MHVAKILTTSITGIALAFSMLASTLPANAASGYHAAYFSESDFLAKSPGQTGQFAVGYTNTGDQAWVKGAAGQQANLATAAPLDNTNDFTAGWSNGWLSANRYTAQNAALVAPGQIGFFIYNFTVPANAPAGEHRFYGREVIDGVTFMEDYGYYQSVTVGTPAITLSSTPASPSNNTTPVISGTGATAGSTVTVSEGATTLCTATAATDGTFSCTTSALAAGSHTITAKDAAGLTSGTLTYVVDTTKPTVTGATAPNTTTVTVTFSKAMNCGTVASNGTATIKNPADYAIAAVATPGTPAGGTITVAPSADCTSATLTLGTPLTNGTQYTVTVTGAQDTAGNTISSTGNTATFLVADTTGPAIVSASATVPATPATASAQTVTVKWSEPVCGTGAVAPCTGSAVYSVDGIATPISAGSGTSTITLNTSGLTTLKAGTSHTVTSFNERDLSGNLQNPNPQSATFTVTTGTAFSQTAATQGATNSIADVTFSGPVACVSGAVSPGTFTITQPTTANAFVVTSAKCDATNPNLVHVAFTGTPTYTSGSATLVVTSTGVKDTFGTPESPDPASNSYNITKDTVAPTIVSATGTTSQFKLTYSEGVTVNTATAYTLTNSAGAAGPVVTACQTTAGSTTVYLQTAGTCGTGTASSIPADTYSLSEAAAAVKDISLEANPNTPQTVTGIVVTAPADTTAPKVCTVAYDGAKTLTITYSESMKTNPTTAGSITNPATYTYDGGALPAANLVASSTAISGTCATAGTTTPTNNTATITLVSTPTTAAHTLGIVNAADLAGNTVSASAGFTGGTASTAVITP